MKTKKISNNYNKKFPWKKKEEERSRSRRSEASKAALEEENVM